MFDGFKFKENATYRIKAKCKTTDNTNAPFISLRQKDDYNKSFKDMRFTNGILNTTFLANNVGGRIEFFAGVNKGNKGGCQVEFWDVCITEELSNEDLPFQPYLKDTNSITIDSPLMRLPNGVCDEITRDGKLIRRVEKVVLDGSENWNLSDGDKENTIRFSMIPQIPFKISMEAISDKFPYYRNTNNNVECFTVATDTKIHIRITRSKLNVANVQGFKEWLSQNPTTVCYELSTPVITELPAPCLRIFKDGQITFNTLVIPESNHVVQLNKSAQIERSIKEVQSLDGRVGQLESFYDNMMLETSYKLNLLNYDFEYTKEREDE